MDSIRILKQFKFILLLSLTQICFQAQAKPTTSILPGHNTSILGDLRDILGEYKGEIRLQNTNGTVDQLLVPNAQFNLALQKDSLVVTAPSGLMGKYCKAEIGGIRELVKNADDEPHLIKALFDYDPGQCPRQKQWNALLLFLSRAPDGNLVLETILTRNPVDLASNPALEQKVNVHGFYTKESHLDISQK